MNNWLQNIKGQITELATEVLNDATEEGQVSASSELQVEKKKCAEAERQFLSEKAKNEALEKRVTEMGEQLFNTNVENDAIKEKFTGIVSDREQQIKRLNWEIERLRCSEEGEFKNINLGSPPKMGILSTNAEVEKAIDKLKEKHNCEMAAIISANATNVQQIRAEYEERIRELELWSSSVSAVGEELTELKEYNQRLVKENEQMHDSLTQLNDLRVALDVSNDELSNFRTKFAEMQETFTKENERVNTERDELINEMGKCQTQEKITEESQCQTDEQPTKAMSTEEQMAEMLEQNVQLKAELNEREEELRRLRNEKVLMADITTTDGQCKRPPSDTDSATSNNDWERMGKEDIEVEGVSSSAGSEEKESMTANRRKKSSELCDSFTQTDDSLVERNSENAKKDKEEIILLRSETEKLQQLLQQKHSECQNYYEKLQEMGKIVEGKSAKLESAEETLRRREREIAMDRERNAKLEGDLQRLREHLLTVEEHSSKDAIAAEERETELRKQIRFLQEKSTTEGTSLAHSLEQYQLQANELHAKVEQLEKDKSQIGTTLAEKEKMLAEMNKTLTDLQSVLKELADDQKTERQKSDEELWSAREELKRKNNAMKQTEEAKANLEDEFANITHELNMAREQLLRKENLVEELENQLEEMRIGGVGKHQFVVASDPSVIIGSRSGGTVSSHKIDDATLRQLFLSYFTAEKSKQPEIAIVMSRILGYSAEEQSQISAALSKSSSSASSWFAPFSAALSASPHPPEGLSLTEQFVRFLEQESMANSRALLRPPIHSLPMTDSGTFLVGESPPVPIQSSSSSADLKSILEQ